MPVKHINIPYNPECATIAQGKEALEHLSGLFELVEQCDATEDEAEKGRRFLTVINQTVAVYEHWKKQYPVSN